MDWFGGKPAGWIQIRDKGCQAIISKHHGSQYFATADYGSLDNAIKEAEKWRYEQSTQLGLTKNRIRLIEPEDGDDPYLEVQLQHDETIMKCDVEHIHLIEESIWSAWKGVGKHVWYARRRASSKKGQDYIMFHSLIYPAYTNIKHINNDGLDNRTANLEPITLINDNIKTNNTSGIPGVYYARDKRGWAAQIGGPGEQRQRKIFTVLKYGEDEAKRLAIRQRRQWERERGYI